MENPGAFNNSLALSHTTRPLQATQAYGHDTNLHLVHLLTTNPAAALPAIFHRGGVSDYDSNEVNMNSTQTGGLYYPTCTRTSQQSTSLIRGTPTTPRVLPPLKRQRSFSELYATREEIEKKSICIDEKGNFDFEALLPAVYWK